MSGNIQRMAGKPNGTHGPQLYLPPASDDWDLPDDPGSFTTNVASMVGPPPTFPDEHQTSVPETFVPEATKYRGGGIFADVVGPAQQTGAEPWRPEKHTPGRGLDYAPMAMPPMAAPGMPDVGAPPMMTGIFDDSMGDIEHEPAHTLGLSVLAVAVGAVAGVRYGGLYGGVAGSLFAGAAVNAYRAFVHFKEGTEESDQEAKISGTYAVGAAVLGAVLWTKLASKGGAPAGFFANPDDGDALSRAEDKFSQANAELNRLDSDGVSHTDPEYRRAQKEYERAVRDLDLEQARARAVRKKKKAQSNAACDIRRVGP